MNRGSSSGTVMDTALYEAVKEGNIKTMEEYKEKLLDQLTPNNNTVLHLTAQLHSSPLHVIDTIFDKQGRSSNSVKSLLTRKNSEGETALHIAARNGRHDVVVALIRHAKDLDEDIERGGAGAGRVAIEMLRTTNNHGDTALHDAVRHKNGDVVEVLVKEDPGFEHPSNDMGETPLYLAVETHYDDHGRTAYSILLASCILRPAYHCHDIVDLILNTCISPGYSGPKNRTALHASVLSKCQGCTMKILMKMPALAKVGDGFGWTPIHYAAFLDFKFGASELLKLDKSVAHYTADVDEKKTALHVAASYGSVLVMKQILKFRPDCWEMVTSKGQNILHLVVDNERRKALGFILSNSWAMNLINQRDDQGNTPLHLFATSKWFYGLVLLSQNRANLNAFNRENCTPLDVLRKTIKDSTVKSIIEGDLIARGGIGGARNVIIEENGAHRVQKRNAVVSQKDLPVDLRKLSDTHLIVAALIATVTFAAGFTVPGGYEDDADDDPDHDHGMAVLTKRAAFKAFIITDTIAVMSSIIAISLHLMGSWIAHSRKLRRTFDVAIRFIKISLLGMVIAFMTGVYTVIESSPALAIAVCVICSFVLFTYSVFILELLLNFLLPIIAYPFSLAKENLRDTFFRAVG